MPDAPFAVEEADAASTNPLLMAHQPAMGLSFFKELSSSMDSMLQLLTGLLEMRHLLLHLLSSLLLVMQLFFELLDETECLL